MGLERFRELVTSVAELETLVGSPSELAIRKQLSELDEHATSFIAVSPFLLVGTVGGDGRCDVSPRGDRPCVARVLDSTTLVVPERRGNRRVDSLRNVVETGRVGLLFLVPGTGETLRVNGRGCVVRDEDLLASMAFRGRLPVAGIGVEVEECYFQCAKAVIRSRLWDDPTDRPPASHLAEVLVDQIGMGNESVESLRRQIDESYRDRLY